jgi:arylsulfate sulfotransferase
LGHARPGLLALSLVLLAGCTSSPGEMLVEAVVSEQIPTVVTVHGQVDLAEVEAAYVEVRADGDWQRTPLQLDEDGEFEQILVGQKPDREYEIRGFAVAGDTTVTSETSTVVTGPVPPFLPHLETTTLDAALDPGGFVVTSLISFPSAAVILDADGEYVWWYRAENEEVPITRVRLSRDGRWMMVLVSELILTEDAGMMEDQPFLRVRMDGSEVVTTGVPGAHHDFLEHTDGTVAFIAHDVREIEYENIRGDRIIEVSPDDAIEEVWSVWDHMDYHEGQNQDPGTGWTHANALDYDEDDEAYYIGLRNYSCIHKVDRGIGEVLWTLGSPESDYRLADGGTHFFEHQHQFEILDGSILVMDNGGTEAGSRAEEFSLDLSLAEALPVWNYQADPPVVTFALGDVQRLPAGETMVTWSTAGQIDLISAEDELIRQVNVGIGGTFGYAYWLETLPVVP